MARKLRQKLGDILVANKLISAAQLQEAIQAIRGTGKRLGEALVEGKFCSEEDVAKALGMQFGMEFLNLERAEDSNKIDIKLIPRTRSVSGSGTAPASISRGSRAARFAT